MAEPTLQDLFGPNATETIDYIQIKKSDLAKYGLIPAVKNTGESIKTAMDLIAMSYLTSTNQTNNADQSIVMELGFNSFVTRNNTTYLQQQIISSFQKPFTSGGLNPMDY